MMKDADSLKTIIIISNYLLKSFEVKSLFLDMPICNGENWKPKSAKLAILPKAFIEHKEAPMHLQKCLFTL